MERAVVLTGLLLAVFSTTAAAQAAEQWAFVLMLGRDTLAVENVTRAPDRLEGELAGPAIGRIVYVGEIGPDALLRSLRLQAWQQGSPADAEPAQEARVTFEVDSAVVVITTAAGTRTQRFGARPGALPYVNPSMGLVEQVLRRARALGGDTAEVPLFVLQGGQTLAAPVTWHRPDSATLRIAMASVQATVSPEGRLTAAAVPAQNLTVTRLDGVHLPPLALEPPDYSAPEGASYTAAEVEVETPAGHTLAGTLTRPAGGARVPAVVLVTGSGSQDRDEAIPTIRGYRPFRAIADTLSRRGVAVLRLDDRGYGASGGDAASATSADFADDIRAALAYLRNRPDIDVSRLGIVGHSEGGLIAPLVAAEDTTLAAIVVMAGPARTGREIIAYQQRQAIERAGIPEAARDSALAAARAQVEEMAGRQPWIRFFLEHDPLPTARRVRHTPVLVLHGATDRQVPAEQAEELAAAFREGGNRDVTVRVFPELNHLLLPDPDGAPAGYSTLTARRVDRELLGVLADWLVDRLR